MERLVEISFVALDGSVPDSIAADRLPSPDAVADVIRSAFAPFLASGSQAADGATGLHVVYAYGHAWRSPDGGLIASVRCADGDCLVADEALIEFLIGVRPPGRTILLLDCCHAAALDPSLAASSRRPRMVVYASAAHEQAIALHWDRASRFSLALAKALEGNTRSHDLARVIAEVAVGLNADGVVQGQTVSYRLHGPAVVVVRGELTSRRRRETTVSRVRNILIGAGAAVSCLLIAAAWFYWSHVLITVELGGLHSIARKVAVVVTNENPSRNESRHLRTERIQGALTRFWIPAENVVVRLEADYRDGSERAMAFHVLFEPGFAPSSKHRTFRLPPSDEIANRPGMAYVPMTAWFHGREREPRMNETAYWIDIRPPSVEEYLPIALKLRESSRVPEEDILLLRWRSEAQAVENVGLAQLPSLSRDLGEIFGVLEAAGRPHPAAPGDLAISLGDFPCPACPAAMSRAEAEMYCTTQGKAVPTDLEWELAARGVDGRVFPWGDRFDPSRANVPGLPEHSAPVPGLQPIDSYKAYPSPFGLIDTVGNAGDWVVNTVGSYENVYMGATYQYNPEDATVFRLLPVTDIDALVREITTRCVIRSE